MDSPPDICNKKFSDKIEYVQKLLYTIWKTNLNGHTGILKAPRSGLSPGTKVDVAHSLEFLARRAIAGLNEEIMIYKRFPLNRNIIRIYGPLLFPGPVLPLHAKLEFVSQGCAKIRNNHLF
jgi:hypothetical protein